MKNLETVHRKLEENLLEIRQVCDDMRQAGLGGDDFASLYVTNRLLPSIVRILFTDRRGARHGKD